MVLSSLSSHVFWLKRTGSPPPFRPWHEHWRRPQHIRQLPAALPGEPAWANLPEALLFVISELPDLFLAVLPPSECQQNRVPMLPFFLFFFCCIAIMQNLLQGVHISRWADILIALGKQQRTQGGGESGNGNKFLPLPPLAATSKLYNSSRPHPFSVCLSPKRGCRGTHRHAGRDILSLCSCNFPELRVPVSL